MTTHTRSPIWWSRWDCRCLEAGFIRLFAGRPGVLVGGDNFWYPVKGDPRTVVAPDVFVIVGMPAVPPLREMGSYRQWEHGGHPTFVVEVLSPSNTYREMLRKRDFYERFGVDEYWVFDPEDGTLEVWLRDDAVLAQVPMADGGHVSPTTGVQVSVVDRELVVHRPSANTAACGVDCPRTVHSPVR